MKKISKTIVFFGNERLATGTTTTCPTLRGLIKAGYDIKAVVSNHMASVSRNQRELEIQKVAQLHDIPVLLPAKPTDITDQLRSYGAEAAVLAAYGRIVPQSIIDLFPKGIINIHPSLLPRHRGPTPIESTILGGEEKTGISLIQLVRAMDAGPVYAQSELELSGKETKQGLVERLGDMGTAMLLELLPGILAGDVVALPQDDSRATYDQLIRKENGVLDWNKSAEQLEREIRAFAGWPGSRTTLAGKEVIITKAHAVPSNQLSAKPGDVEVVAEGKNLIAVTVETANGYLCIDRLKPAGKKEMSAHEFMAGHKHLL